MNDEERAQLEEAIDDIVRDAPSVMGRTLTRDEVLDWTKADWRRYLDEVNVAKEATDAEFCVHLRQSVALYGSAEVLNSLIKNGHTPREAMDLLEQACT